jgi:hypothetical protein
MRERRIQARGSGRSAAVQPAAVPGKSTRSGRYAAGTPSGDDHAIALQGVAGAGSALPFRDQLETSFGQSLDGVGAHLGVRQASALGASAYAAGDQIAFADPAPPLELVAHEVTHVFQQRGGVQLADGLGQAGDRYEIEADDVAARVARGESVAGRVGNGASRGEVAAVQRSRDGSGSLTKIRDFYRTRDLYRGRAGQDRMDRVLVALGLGADEVRWEDDGDGPAVTDAFIARARIWQSEQGLGLKPDGMLGRSALVRLGLNPPPGGYAVWNADDLRSGVQDPRLRDLFLQATFLTRCLQVITGNGEAKRFGDITGDDGIAVGLQHLTGEAAVAELLELMYTQYPERFVETLFGPHAAVDGIDAIRAELGLDRDEGDNTALARIAASVHLEGFLALFRDPRFQDLQVAYFSRHHLVTGLDRGYDAAGDAATVGTMALITVVGNSNTQAVGRLGTAETPAAQHALQLTIGRRYARETHAEERPRDPDVAAAFWEALHADRGGGGEAVSWQTIAREVVPDLPADPDDWRTVSSSPPHRPRRLQLVIQHFGPIWEERYRGMHAGDGDAGTAAALDIPGIAEDGDTRWGRARGLERTPNPTRERRTASSIGDPPIESTLAANGAAEAAAVTAGSGDATAHRPAGFSTAPEAVLPPCDIDVDQFDISDKASAREFYRDAKKFRPDHLEPLAAALGISPAPPLYDDDPKLDSLITAVARFQLRWFGDGSGRVDGMAGRLTLTLLHVDHGLVDAAGDSQGLPPEWSQMGARDRIHWVATHEATLGVREDADGGGRDADRRGRIAAYRRHGGTTEGRHPWCAAFVSYCYNVAQVPIPGGPTGHARAMRDQFHAATRLTSVADVAAGVATPARGDVIFVPGSSGESGHVGLVDELVARQPHVVVRTIEGNTKRASDTPGEGAYFRGDAADAGVWARWRSADAVEGDGIDGFGVAVPGPAVPGGGDAPASGAAVVVTGEADTGQVHGPDLLPDDRSAAARRYYGRGRSWSPDYVQPIADALGVPAVIDRTFIEAVASFQLRHVDGARDARGALHPDIDGQAGPTTRRWIAERFPEVAEVLGERGQAGGATDEQAENPEDTGRAADLAAHRLAPGDMRTPRWSGGMTLDDYRALPDRPQTPDGATARDIAEIDDAVTTAADRDRRLRDAGYDGGWSQWSQAIGGYRFLGRDVQVHEILARRLARAEAWLLDHEQFRGMSAAAIGAEVIREDFKCLRHHRTSYHAFGLAIDVNYATNPWVGGDPDHPTANQHTLAAIWRAGWLTGAGTSYSPADASALARGGASTEEIFQYVDRADAALERYFALRDDPTALEALVSALGEPPPLPTAAVSAEASTADALRDTDVAAWRRRIDEDWRATHGRGTNWGTRRSPGMLDLELVLVQALRDHAGLAWGACDLGDDESGDMMHFDCRTDDMARAARAGRPRGR